MPHASGVKSPIADQLAMHEDEIMPAYCPAPQMNGIKAAIRVCSRPERAADVQSHQIRIEVTQVQHEQSFQDTYTWFSP
jgi:hypothetical protein